MATQTVLFTAVPRGIRVEGDTLPVSVVVSPRLMGDSRLGAFSDWLQWTRRLQDGLSLEFRCAGQSLQVRIDPKVLQPDLWEQLFNEATLVRSHQIDDYSKHGIISYSMRESLSALKTIYQEASVKLALPEAERGPNDERGNRGLLTDLVEGLDVHWNGDNAPRWRDAVRRMNTSERVATAQQGTRGSLDREGLITSAPDPAAFKRVAIPFAVFHHMPTPDRDDDLKLDTKTVLDFHQVLTSLNAYPELQRSLGLVFDLELPRSFVPETPLSQPGTLSVRSTSFNWRVKTTTPELATSYLHVINGTQRLFLTTPRAIVEPDAPVTILGLLDLNPERFGLAQVDVDGGMHKAMILAETLNNPDPDRNLDKNARPEPAPHPEVFDTDATLPSLRSGGFSLFADRRGLQLLDSLKQSKGFNDAVTGGNPQPRPFFAEDLVRGYRLDVWDARTNTWHSLHRRSGVYEIGDRTFKTEEEEGFLQLAATQPAPGAKPADKDLYLHEAIARWTGWSLSAPRPGKHLSRYADPSKAVPPDRDDPDYREDQPDTPFKLSVDYRVIPGSLPRLRFGTRYRIRARAVDLAGNSLQLSDPIADSLATTFALPRDLEGFAYLRYEPVGAPLLILRDAQAVTAPGSAIDRLVIRSFNDDISKDSDPADLTAADRHLVPPRTSVEMGERLGLFDDGTGKLQTDPATWQLIAQRDAGEFQQASIEIAGKTDQYPLEASDRIDTLPHLPDPLSRGAAIRNLPGTPSGSIAKVASDGDATAAYTLLNDPNPRPGSATLISFGDSGDWQQTRGFRFALSEPQPNQTDVSPHWDAANRVLTVYLPKGQTAVVPVSSYLSSDDLKLMGVWQWLREYIERITLTEAQSQQLNPGAEVDAIAHVLQRTVEGGHWMLTPPRLLTLIHALQQPLGRPAFTALSIGHEAIAGEENPLQTAPIAGRTDPTELAPITAWRRPGATDAFLMGALHIHGASTAKIDLQATWNDPIDDLSQPRWTTTTRTAHVDELSLSKLKEGYLRAKGKAFREVGYYDPEHDQIGFVRTGAQTNKPNQNPLTFRNATPRHLFNDTKHHRVHYTAIATSRYQEYFPADQELNFTRTSEAVAVDVPASARPLAPAIAYVLPTFGWQRQTDTNLKRSVRFGGGLRVYLHRPWFSSGEGELLGVAIWSVQNGTLNAESRDKFKPFITQWGMDPIWQTATLSDVPAIYNFPDAVSVDAAVTLEEHSATNAKGEPGRINVAGFPVQFDESRGLWYADLTLNLPNETYMPFVRLALVRYQPHALADAKVSRVVLADFAQLTPDRSTMLTADPHHPRSLRGVVSGVAPRGPQAIVHAVPNPTTLSPHPTQIRVRVQQRNPAIQTDLTWQDVTAEVATVQVTLDDRPSAHPDLERWAGTITFAQRPQPGQFRLLIEEHEYISANYSLVEGRTVQQPGRLIYAETFELDDALVSET
jgi:hypothetical protein